MCEGLANVRNGTFASCAFHGPAGHNACVLLAYCTGLIVVCTALLIFASVVTMQNYWMLRRLTAGPPGKHENAAHSPVDEPKPIRRVDSRRHGMEHYDSGFPAAADGEWSGPVTPYTPADRGDS